MIKKILLLGLLLLSACVTMQGQFAPSLTTQHYPVRTAPEKIEIFRTQAPTKAFEEIGTVQACCSASTNTLVDMLREQASKNGGDAIVGLDLQARGGATAAVVRYKD